MNEAIPHRRWKLRTEGGVNPGVHPVAVTIEALGIDLEQDIDRVPGTFGDVGRWDAGVEPERHPGVAHSEPPRVW